MIKLRFGDDGNFKTGGGVNLSVPPAAAAPPSAQSATRFAGSINVESPGTFLDDWDDIDFMGAADDSPATCALTYFESEIVTLSDFGFTIPPEATIDGVVVTIRRSQSGAGSACKDQTVQLYKSGVVGANKASALNWPSFLAEAVYGGASDLWGMTLTPSEVNDAAFRVKFKVVDDNGDGVTVYVDYISVTVHYTA
ncbi:MAG TPA: hypothetical protein VEZ40_06135 [Pyrinomonadaceae bacterium]|nr:hypothetical protein [Pyrinomonadaceae bacterium]